ncbi:MAG: dTDP-4-dehydrorhamnose reductase [Chitinophagaceae bacterium]
MQQILVTGANGQLGRELQQLSENHSYFKFYFFSRNDLDITNTEAIKAAFSKVKPDHCINCAAYTTVDKAETETEQAYAINTKAVKDLALISAEHRTNFIHISTDYVFDGTATNPYKEDDVTNPINVYGASKRLGEIEALKANGQSIVIRTSWLYSVYGNNFVKTMHRLMQTRSDINVVADQYGSPTNAADLAQIVLTILQSQTLTSGIYHFSNEGSISWYDFATEIKKIIGSSCNIHPITTEQYPTAAKRPKYSVLEKEKIQQVFGIQIKSWQESLKTCLMKLSAA